MTDYNKFTVIQIREQLKERGIAATGLTRKQQLIDRLLEADKAEAKSEILTQDEIPPESQVPGDAAPAASENHSSSREGVKKSPVETPIESRTNIQVEEKPRTQDSQEPLEQKLSKEPPVEQKQDEGPQKLQHDRESPKQELVETLALQQADSVFTGPESVNAIPTIEEDPRLPAAAPPATTESALPSDNEENRKRKRRSPSPAVIEADVVRKRHKMQSPRIEADTRGDEFTQVGSEVPVRPANAQDDAAVTTDAGREGSTAVAESTTESNEAPMKSGELDPMLQQSTTTRSHTRQVGGSTKSQGHKDKRYRDLHAPTQDIHSDDADATEEVGMRSVGPAIHSATNALYIRNFKRPLRPEQLRDHLNRVARPPGTADSGDEAVVGFHLDNMRTHCFVSFTSAAAAARVRSALHDRIWPVEPQREPLWADYIPEERVKEWTETELAGGRGMKKWEVTYDTVDQGIVEARLQEANASAASGAAPRRSIVVESGSAPTRPLPTPEVRREVVHANGKAVPQPASFLALDSLFKSTTAKPKLYFLPVSQSLIDRRLDELDARKSRRLAAAGSGGGGGTENRRYTFEEGSLLVDNGPEFGLRQESSHRGRGGYRGGYRGR